MIWFCYVVLVLVFVKKCSQPTLFTLNLKLVFQRLYYLFSFLVILEAGIHHIWPRHPHLQPVLVYNSLHSLYRLINQGDCQHYRFVDFVNLRIRARIVMMDFVLLFGTKKISWDPFIYKIHNFVKLQNLSNLKTSDHHRRPMNCLIEIWRGLAQRKSHETHSYLKKIKNQFLEPQVVLEPAAVNNN